MNLKQYAEQAINNVKAEFNVELFERTKDLFIISRAEMLSQSIDKRGTIDDQYKQRYVINLVKVDIADTCVIDVGCLVLRSENKVATPLRTRGDVPFLYVGSVDGGITFTYAKRSEIKFIKHLKYSKFAIRYEYINNYLYVYLNTRIKHIAVDAVYESPELVTDECSGSAICYNDEMEFPIPMDIVNRVKDRVYKELLLLRRPPIEATEVKVIKEEDK